MEIVEIILTVTFLQPIFIYIHVFNKFAKEFSVEILGLLR